jgi:hypothetical protein
VPSVGPGHSGVKVGVNVGVSVVADWVGVGDVVICIGGVAVSVGNASVDAGIDPQAVNPSKKRPYVSRARLRI